MLKEFTVQKKLDIKALQEFNEELEIILGKLDFGNIFEQGGYSVEEYKELLSSFIEGQRGKKEDVGRTLKDSWSIVNNSDGMDGDARVEFNFKPTYLVTAILSRTLCDYPLIAISIPGYGNALKHGMKYCSLRQLYGHGYEAFSGAAEALTILSRGKVPYLLEKNKEFCPNLYNAIVKVTEEMKEAINTDKTIDGWGNDLQEEFSSALETLYIRNDRESYEAALNTDENSELYSEEDLLW